jgi:hypothetical protein
MATSISKAQADALAKGFFDSIGSSEDLKPTETLSALYLLAGGLVDDAQKNLNKADQVASGKLSESLKVLNPESVGRNVRIDISALYYFKFLNEGVKGTKGGSGKYAFKNNKVGGKMLTSIRKWLIREGLKSRTRTGGPAITKRESRRKSITETSNSVAYGIAVGVKMKGIKRSNFFTDAVRTTQAKAKDQLAKGLKLDIINSLPSKL